MYVGLWRRSLDREYPEAGLRHQGSGTADAAAGHQGQRLTDRPRSGRPDAIHALQRQELGAFWRAADRELEAHQLRIRILPI